MPETLQDKLDQFLNLTLNEPSSEEIPAEEEEPAPSSPEELSFEQMLEGIGIVTSPPATPVPAETPEQPIETEQRSLEDRLQQVLTQSQGQQVGLTLEDLGIELPEIQIFTLPERKLPGEEAKKEPITQFLSQEDAENYLILISKEYPPVNDVITDILQAKEDLAISEEKEQAQSLGTAVGKITLLIDNLNTIIDNSEEKEKTAEALKTIQDHLNIFVSDFSSKNQSVFAKFLAKTVKVPRRLLELESRYLGSDTKFVRNRAVRIQINEGLDSKTAEERAKAELNEINKAIQKLDLSGNLPQELKTEFQKQLLGGSSWEDAIKYIEGYVKLGGIEYFKDKFKDIEVEEDDWKEIVPALDDSIVQEKLNYLPEAERSNLTDKIMRFKDLGGQIGKIIEDNIEMRSTESVEQAKLLYDEFSALANQIFIIDPSYIEGDEALFEDVYSLYTNIRNITAGFIDISSEETISDIKQNQPVREPIPIKQDETKEKVERKRKTETEEKARQAFLKRLKDEGVLDQYLSDQKRRKTEREKDPVVKELKRIRNPDYISNKQEINKLVYLAKLPSLNNREIIQIKQNNIKRTISLLKRIKESWLSDEQLQVVMRDLLNKRIRDYDALLKILSRQEGINEDVLDFIEELMDLTPKIFSEALSTVKDLEVGKFKPGQTRKISEIISLMKLFLKHSSLSN